MGTVQNAINNKYTLAENFYSGVSYSENFGINIKIPYQKFFMLYRIE